MISCSMFAVRCYASAAYAIMWCLCACLSVTFVHSVKMNKHIFIIFSQLGSQAILFFKIPNGMATYQRDPPPNGSVECRWGRQKFAILSLDLASLGAVTL